MTLREATEHGLWEWHAPTGARAVFTSAALGNVATHVPHDREQVRAARKAAAAVLGMAPTEVVHVSQVHGADVWYDLGTETDVDPAMTWVSMEPSPVEADALVTSAQDRPLAIVTADCVPVAVALGSSVAAIHAGWRSVDLGVLEQTLAVLVRAAGSSGALAGSGPFAAIGPAIGPCCMQVGSDVAARFTSVRSVQAAGAASRYWLDLPAEVEHRLERLGVTVERPGVCTCCDARWFSHRRDGAGAGRQALIVTGALQ